MTKKINDNVQVLGEVTATKINIPGSIPLYRSASSLEIWETININDIFYIEKAWDSDASNRWIYEFTATARIYDGVESTLIKKCLPLETKLSTWLAWVQYTLNDIVIYGWDIFRCNSITSVVWEVPADPGDWVKIITWASATVPNVPATISTFVAWEAITEWDFLAIHTDWKAYRLWLTYTKYIWVANNTVAVSWNVDIVTEWTTSKVSWLTIGEKYYYNLAGEQYTAKTLIPTNRYEHSSTAANWKIYLFGWLWTGTTTSEYNPLTNTWASKTALPADLWAHTSEAINWKIYIMGWYSGWVQNTNWEYDVILDSWASKTAMPDVRMNHSSAVIDWKIYVFGWDSTGWNVATNTTWEYDPVANSWAVKTVMPTSLLEHASEAVNWKIYVFGWRWSAATYEYDPVANSWLTKSVLEQNIYAHSSAVINWKIYTFWWYNGSVLNTNYKYDPVTNIWSSWSGLPLALMNHSSSEINWYIYIFWWQTTWFAGQKINYEYFVGWYYLNTITSDNLVWLATSATSLILNNPKLSISESGTYTPTVTAVANVSATAVLWTTAMYNRVWKIVTVSWHISITATAATTLTQVYITLPFARTFTTNYWQISWVISAISWTLYHSGWVIAQSDMTKWTFSLMSNSTIDTYYSYTLSYILE